MSKIKGITGGVYVTKKLKKQDKLHSKDKKRDKEKNKEKIEKICNDCELNRTCPYFSTDRYRSYLERHKEIPNINCDKLYVSAGSKSQVTIGRNEITGKIIKKSFSGNNAEDAMNKALNAKLEIAKNGGEKIINRSTISIKQLDLDFLEEQFKTHEIKEATYGKYLKDLKKMSQNKFYTKPIVNVKRQEIVDYLQSLTSYSDTIIKESTYLIKQAYRRALLNQIDVQDYFSGLNKIEKPKSIQIPKAKFKKSLTLSEESQIINYLNEVPKSKCKRKDVILLMLLTGMRVGEVLALRYDKDIDLDNRTITVRRTLTKDINGKTIIGQETKTENGIRVIPLDDFTFEVLQRLMEQKINNKYHLLVCSDKKDILNTNSINSSVKRVAKVLNIGEAEIYDKIGNISTTNLIHSHMMRATYATRAAESGMSKEALKDTMGHASIGITDQYYIDVDNDYVKKQTEAVGDYLKNVGVIKEDNKKVDGKVDCKVDCKVESKIDNKIDNKVEDKIEDKVEDKVEDKKTNTKNAEKL